MANNSYLVTDSSSTLSKTKIKQLDQALDFIIHQLQDTPGLGGFTYHDHWFSTADFLQELHALINTLPPEIFSLYPQLQGFEDPASFRPDQLRFLTDLQHALGEFEATLLPDTPEVIQPANLKEMVKSFQTHQRQVAAGTSSTPRLDIYQQYQLIQDQVKISAQQLTPQVSALLQAELGSKYNPALAAQIIQAHYQEIYHTVHQTLFSNTQTSPQDIAQNLITNLHDIDSLPSASIPDTVSLDELSQITTSITQSHIDEVILPDGTGRNQITQTQIKLLHTPPDSLHALESVNQTITSSTPPNQDVIHHALVRVQDDLLPRSIAPYIRLLESTDSPTPATTDSLTRLTIKAVSTEQKQIIQILQAQDASGQLSQSSVDQLRDSFTSIEANDLLHHLNQQLQNHTPIPAHQLHQLSQQLTPHLSIESTLHSSLLAQGLTENQAQTILSRLPLAHQAVILSHNPLINLNDTNAALAETLHAVAPELTSGQIQNLLNSPEGFLISQQWHAWLNLSHQNTLNHGHLDPSLPTNTPNLPTPQQYSFNSQDFHTVHHYLSHLETQGVLDPFSDPQTHTQLSQLQADYHHRLEAFHTRQLQILHHPQGALQHVTSFFYRQVVPRLPQSWKDSLLRRFLRLPEGQSLPHLDQLLQSLPQEIKIGQLNLGAPKGILEFLRNPFGSLKSLLGGTGEGVGGLGAAGQKAGGVFRWLSGGLSNITTKLGTIAPKISGLVSQGIGAIGKALPAIIQGVSTFLASVGAATAPVTGPVVLAIVLVVLIVLIWFGALHQTQDSAETRGIGSKAPSDYIASICQPGTEGCAPISCPNCEWPVSCGSITQCPGDSFSHSTLNAIDFGMSSCGAGGLGVFAPFEGTVTIGHDGDYFGTGDGYGNYAILTFEDPISHNTYQLLFGHLAPGTVKAGPVTKKDNFATVDNTGFSTGNHLHYELRSAGDGPAPNIATIVPDSGCKL